MTRRVRTSRRAKGEVLSYAAQAWAADQKPKTGTDKLVLIALAYYAGKADGGLCWPGQETIAEFAVCSVDSVQRSLKRLAADGYIVIEKSTDSNGQRKYDRYRLLFDITTTAPDGSRKRHHANHAANCGVAGAKSESHAQGAEQAETAAYHAANCGVDHAANHTANHAANHAANCGPNLKEPIEPLEPLPPTPQGASAGGEGNSNFGWNAKWDRPAREATAHVRTAVTTAKVVTAFLDAVRGTLAPPVGVDGAAYVRQLVAQLREHTAADLARTADILLGLVPSLAGHEDAARKRDLPSAVDVGRLADAVRAERLRTEAVWTPGAAVPVAGADPEIVARTAAVMAIIKARIGTPAFDAWFKGCALVRRDGARLVLSAPNSFLAGRINAGYRDHLLAAARTIWPDVVCVDAVEAAKLGRAA